ncbi:MAG: acyl-CoA dehydrogenase family protein [Alphaproteobacteria bacterium]|nr:acyl-CoA dehydrogenase family protein [Alphaproteobacteria bacterium]
MTPPSLTQARDRSYLQWPFLEERHRALADSLLAFANTLPHQEVSEATVDAVTRGHVAHLAAEGWLTHAVAGTHPLDVRSLCLIREHLAFADGLAEFAFAMQGLGMGPISLFGTAEQKARWLPEVVAGRAIAAFALSEAAAGSDVSALATRAERDGNGWVLNGSKTWISNAGIADVYIVFARTGEAPGAKGLSAFLVPADTPGFKVSARLPVMAPHPLGSLLLEDVRLTGDALIGEPGRGFAVAMATLDVFRSTVGAAALGFARRALAETLVHTKQRILFAKPLAEHQLTQGRLADMALGVDQAALLVYRAAWTKDVIGGRISREASMAKLGATEIAHSVIDSAVQLHGGAGVMVGGVPERLYREIRALRIYEGASEVQKLIIAGQTLAPLETTP